MHVTVLIEHQLPISIDIHPKSSIMDLKQAITSEIHIPVDDFMLVQNANILCDSRPLLEYGIVDSSQISMLKKLREPELIQITILLPDEVHLIVEVDKEAKVEHLKQAIVAKTGDTFKPIELIFNHWKLDDGRKLSEYSIGLMAEIMLVIRLGPPEGDRPLSSQAAGAELSTTITVHFIGSDRGPINLVCDIASTFSHIRAQLSELMRNHGKMYVFSYDGNEIKDESSLEDAKLTLVYIIFNNF